MHQSEWEKTGNMTLMIDVLQVCVCSEKSSGLLAPSGGGKRSPKPWGRAKFLAPHVTSPLRSASWPSARLIRMLPVERPQNLLVDDMSTWNPHPVFWSVHLLVNQVFPTSAMAMDVQDRVDGVHRATFAHPWRHGVSIRPPACPARRGCSGRPSLMPGALGTWLPD